MSPLHHQVPTVRITIQVVKLCKTTRWNLLGNILNKPAFIFVKYSFFRCMKISRENAMSCNKMWTQFQKLFKPMAHTICDLTNFFTFLLAIWGNGPTIYGWLQKVWWRFFGEHELHRTWTSYYKMPENHSEKWMSSNGQNGEKIEMI